MSKSTLHATLSDGLALSGRRFVLPVLVTMIGIGLTIFSATAVHRQNQEEDKRQRDLAVLTLERDLRARIAGYVDLTHSTKSLFAATGSVTRSQFASYVDSLLGDERYPGLQGLAWAVPVSRSERRAFEDSVRADSSVNPEGYPDFRIRTDDSEREMVVLQYLHPFEGNEGAFGYDILTSPVRRAALETAQATGRPVATAPLELAADIGSQQGLLLVEGVFDSGERTRPLGYVVSGYRIEDLLAGATSNPDVRFSVVDLGAVELEAVDLASDGEAEGYEIIFRSHDGISMGSESFALEVGGRQWRVGLEERAATPFSFGVFANVVAGLVATFGLVAALLLLQRTSARAEAKAQRLTEDLRASTDLIAQVQERFQIASKASKVGLWEYDVASETMWVSDQLANQLGANADGWNSWDDFVERLHPDDRTEALSVPISATLGQMQEDQFRLRHADGSYRTIRARSMTIGSDGVPTRSVGAHVDATDDELVRLNEALIETNSQLDEFTRLASHDLRSPLRAIRSLVGFLRDDAADVLNEQSLDHLEKIDARAARMNRLLNGLLEYARVGDQASAAELVNLADLVTETIATLETQGCNVVADDVEQGEFWLHAAPFSSCLRNLIDNACKHHHRRLGLVVVTLEVNDGVVELQVSDDGPGIAAEYHEQIFEPFRTLRSHDEIEGNGIGLSVVVKILRTHKGSIAIESEPGSGATFTLRWPLTEHPPIGTESDEHRRVEASTPVGSRR